MIFYLVRHGDTGVRGRISGRTPGIHLVESGRVQAKHTAERLRNIPLDAVFSSPLERAIETAEIIAAIHNVQVHVSPELAEIEYGDWTGKTFDELASDPEWRQFNRFRGVARVPRGETMLQVQTRFVGWMEAIRRDTNRTRVVAVSHQDPIKAAVMHYAGLHIDSFDRFDVGPASISALRVDDKGPHIFTINNEGLLAF